MQDVNALIERLRNGLDGLGENPTIEDLNTMIVGIFGCRLCDISCFLTDSDVFQTLLDAIPSPVYYKNKKGTYQACNKALENLYGVKRADIIGKNAYDFFPKDTADKFTNGDRHLFEEDSEERVEHRGRFLAQTDGFHIIHKRSFSRNGKVEGILGVIMDMTENKMVEDCAWASEAFFKSLFESSPMPIVLVNSFNMIMDMNSAAVRFFPPENAVPGQEVSSLFKSHSDIEKLMTSEEQTARVDVIGTNGPVEMIAMVSSNVLNGELCHAFAFLRTDI